MAIKTKVAFAAVTLALATQAMASITLYEGEGFRGRAVTLDRAVGDLDRMRFDNRAGSIIVDRGRWEVCERERFEGRCALLRRGHYDSLRTAGLDWRISSIRPAGNRQRYDVEPAVSTAPLYEYRRRPTERVYEVPVTWSRAVMGASNQRCWVERQAVPTSNANIGGAVAGAVIGGVLGHQIGGGSGKDAATAAGVIGGAVVGSQIAGGSQGYTTQDVQKCTTVAPSGPPAYYEVGYQFRGTNHRVQMASAPGTVIVVNERGEPRM
jgi:uncharacterized protein YcfJ